MKLTIKVTQRDILSGIGTAASCPVALAARRALAKSKHPFTDVSVDANEINFLPDYWASPLPVKAIAFIRQFDNGAPVKPFSFTLDIPPAN